MASISLLQQAPLRPERSVSSGGAELIYTRFGAAPHPQAPISEPRYIHALMIAAWLGRLIDPVDLAHHPIMGLWSAKDAK